MSELLLDYWLRYNHAVEPGSPDEAECAFYSGAATALMMLSKPNNSFDSLIKECNNFTTNATMDDLPETQIQ